MNNFIIVDTKEKNPKLKLIDKSSNKELLKAEVFIGKNGTTINKIEGDGKTPIGTFEIGIVFGVHDKCKIILDDSLEYIKINQNLYWVDDFNSKYYNTLVDITKIDEKFKSAEHLIDYLVQYEYAIEIKTNPENVPGKGSAIFIHCSNGNKTAGCVAIEKDKMINLLKYIDKNTKVIIE